MKMVKDKLGDACKSIAVEAGICSIDPQAAVPYLAMAHMEFDSLEQFQATFAEHAAQIMSDAPNYTNIEPVIQIGEVKL